MGLRNPTAVYHKAAGFLSRLLHDTPNTIVFDDTQEEDVVTQRGQG